MDVSLSLSLSVYIYIYGCIWMYIYIFFYRTSFATLGALWSLCFAGSLAIRRVRACT